mmetsp:Transcript_9711/g.15575  ORF Transcript_9711/g.15575 Transcript_9711/m.15575 type:complete len:256 (-) Transcript_9711:138-905(-)
MPATDTALVDVETGNGTAFANIPPEPEMKGPLKPVAETTPKERLTAVIAGITIALSLAAMVVEGGAVVVVAGILSIIMGPYAYYQQTRLTDIATLKETTAAMEVEVNRFKEENKKLTSSVNELGETIDDLQDVEEALTIISQTEAQSVEALEKQVEENKEILDRMQKSTHGRIIQNMITIVYRGDKNMDNIISEDEATKMIDSLKEVRGVTVHEDRLRIAIVGKSVEAIVDVVQNLLGDDVPEEKRIFEVSSKKK